MGLGSYWVREFASRDCIMLGCELSLGVNVKGHSRVRELT